MDRKKRLVAYILVLIMLFFNIPIINEVEEVSAVEVPDIVFPTTYWSANASTSDLYTCNVSGEYDSSGTYIYIFNEGDFVKFANSVNSGTTYSGYNIVLQADLDLSQHLWTPVDEFRGVLDGNNHTISGLRVMLLMLNILVYLATLVLIMNIPLKLKI